ncbi:MAG: response regulator transcription factor [Cryobacterium sp.]|nr:response regulator transcription factor [Oligoflexia bacterium]
MKTKQKILQIEDQLESQILARRILSPDYDLECVGLLGEARSKLEKESFDLILLDANLPDGDGFTFLAEMRRDPRFTALTVFFLTGRADVNDRVAAFSMGAADYIVKPFEPREFRARVDAKLRSNQKKSADPVLSCGTLRVDPRRFRVLRETSSGAGAEISLTPYELKILTAFIENEDVVLTRNQLIDVAWGESVNVLERTVDRHVSSLRRKLGNEFERIDPIHGVGYRFQRSPKLVKLKKSA